MKERNGYNHVSFKKANKLQFNVTYLFLLLISQILMQLIADPLWTITARKKERNIIEAGQIYYLYR